MRRESIVALARLSSLSIDHVAAAYGVPLDEVRQIMVRLEQRAFVLRNEEHCGITDRGCDLFRQLGEAAVTVGLASREATRYGTHYRPIVASVRSALPR